MRRWIAAKLVSHCRPSKSRRDRRHRIAFLEPLERRIVLNNGAVKLIPISTPFNYPIAIDYLEPSNSLIVSDNRGLGTPHNFDRINPDGTQTQFSSASGWLEEVYFAAVRSGQVGGWTVGDVYSGNGVAGQIAKISNNGGTLTNPWVTLPGETGLLRGAVTFDRTGVFGGDLIAVSLRGGVWRVNALGQATMLANLSQASPPSNFPEGAVVVPADAGKYGPLAGKIVVTDENQTGVYTINPSGSTAYININVSGMEDLKIVPPNQNFYAVNYSNGQIDGAAAADFTSMVGDLLIAREYHGADSGLVRLYYDGNALRTQTLTLASGSATAGQWEHTGLVKSWY